MSSSNSFNICPRCGNSNSLNAKYCSRCGAQLKIPTEAVVCHKCHTRNSALANFCRNCGATLKVGAQTKICPRCGREIGAEENICACGYSFVTLQQTEPRQVNVASTNKDRKKDKKRDKNRHAEDTYVANSDNASAQTQNGKKPKKSGRGFAIVALILIALFAYIIIAPATARPAFLTNFDKGFYHHSKESAPTAVLDNATQLFADGEGETQTPTDTESGTENEGTEPPASEGTEGGTTEPTTPPAGSETENTNPPASESAEQEYVYGWSLIADFIKLFTDETHKADMAAYEGGSFKYIIDQLGTATFVMIAILAVFLITALFHLIVCIIRIISPKRSKRANLLYLILAIITTIFVALMLCAHFLPAKEGFVGSLRNFFIPKYNGVECSYGFALIFIPVYYWFFWIYSHIAKKKAPKKSEQAK